MKHYVYKIIDPITNEFYIGSRTHIEPKNDKYMGSYKVWNPVDKNRLLKEIISDAFETREEAIEFESQLISNNIDNPLNRNYNIPNKGFNTTGLDVCSKDAFIKRYGKVEGISKYNSWLNNIKNTMKEKMNSMTDEERSEKFGSSGEKNPNYGNNWSDDWKSEQSKRMIEYYKNHTPPRKGATHTENTKKKMSEFRKEYYKNNSHPKLGIKYTDEQKNIIKEALKKQPKVTCPYCGIITNKGNASRWHFDNCKNKLN